MEGFFEKLKLMTEDEREDFLKEFLKQLFHYYPDC